MWLAHDAKDFFSLFFIFRFFSHFWWNLFFMKILHFFNFRVDKHWMCVWTFRRMKVTTKKKEMNCFSHQNTKTKKLKKRKIQMNSTVKRQWNLITSNRAIFIIIGCFDILTFMYISRISSVAHFLSLLIIRIHVNLLYIFHSIFHISPRLILSFLPHREIG